MYGSLSFLVERSRRDLRIRLAIGAERGQVAARLLGRGLILAAMGVAAGLALGLAGGRFLSGFLFGVPPTDPLTFVVVPVLLLGATALACGIPAKRAAGIDPMEILRGD